MCVFRYRDCFGEVCSGGGNIVYVFKGEKLEVKLIVWVIRWRWVVRNNFVS